MFLWIVRGIRGVLWGSSMHRHPSAIALASSFGLAVGSMPKDNLFVLSLAAAGCFLRMNYLWAVAIAGLVSMGVPWTDGLTGGIGRWMLEAPWLQALWKAIANWPLLPWFRWNNTVVLGSFLLGVTSFIPIYVMCAIVRSRLVALKAQNRIDGMVDDMQEYQIQIRSDQNRRLSTRTNNHSIPERHRTIKQREMQRHRIDETPGREAIKPNIMEMRPEPAMAVLKSEMPSKSASAVLHETVIEIVRYRPKPSSHSHFSDDVRQAPYSMVKPVSPMNTIPNGQENSSTMRATAELAETKQTLPTASDSMEPSTPSSLPEFKEASTEKPREEALRYLLWHLSGMHRQSRHQEPVS